MIPIWWGERPYGTVHQVPGVCHVTTVFFHLYHIPFFPYRTYLVADAPAVAEEAVRSGRAKLTGYGFVGVRLPLSLLSVVTTAVRGLILFAGFVAATAAVVLPLADPGNVVIGSRPHLISCGVLVGCGVLFWLSRLATRAGQSRRAELLAALGLPEYPDAGSYSE